VLLYKQLYDSLNYLEPDKIEQIYKAYLFALEYHTDQKRDSGEKYITHPIAVACILAQMWLDHQSIIAALLHDVIEDTPATKDEIVVKFGSTVAELVDGVTKLSQMEGSDKDDSHAQNFRKMVLAMSRDIRVILIKLADRLHNMRTVFSASLHKRRRVARETLDIYAPIANRLGMYKMSVELEDLSFAALYPRRYKILEHAVEQVYGKHKEVIESLTKELNYAFTKNNLTNIKILGRIKHLYGIYKKMLNHKASFVNIMDVYGFRIVVPTADDCYRAIGIVHNLYKPFPGKFKDYIAIPKFNGYQSLHTVLFGPYGAPVEVQIRNQTMDRMANDGIAAHWLYKSKGDEAMINATHVRAQQWVNKLIEMQQYATSSSEFFENVKVDLFPDKVYVFTPKGEIMELMRGATVVDFAYSIHTDIGDSCVAARINRKFSPLSTVLVNGQTVSIVTSPASHPNPAWLNFVITSKARNSIRQYLRNQKKEDLIGLGKQLLDKAFVDLNFDFDSIRPETTPIFLKEEGYKDLNALYENIGLGNKTATLVAYQLINKNKLDLSVDPQDTTIKPLLIRGAEGVAINFASCCYPIPGDEIVGYLNTGFGLDIHTDDCANMARLRKQPERCLHVCWADDVGGDFRVALSLETTNEMGVLAEVTRAISKTNANIDGISSMHDSEGHVLIFLYLLVKNAAHLERVTRHIGGVKSVVSVVRRRSN
jgi:GTP diphosphokinase / guanosine-3',5'-bis(diphosphate) 3'-diphosphatase